jgi:SAM-dependent methyltransferase
MTDLLTQFGAIDIYLFDQLQRGRIPAGESIFDAGCGTGRNIEYFLRQGYRVFGADANAASIDAVRQLAERLAPGIPADAFRLEPVEAMSFPDQIADFVISSAVLHFARDEEHFWAMLHGTWRVLRPGGIMFCRVAGLTGLEGKARPLGGRRYALPNSQELFLTDEALLRSATQQLGAELLDPLKTTVVHGQRSMTTWVVRKAQ